LDFRIAALAAYLVTRVAEVCIHRSNYRILREAGAEELIPKLMRRYYLYSLLIIPASIGERLVVGQDPPARVVLIGLVALAVGVLLRTWAIGSLGTLWSMRCLAVPGLRALRVGPYRFLDNPEYISRLIDGVGISVVLGGSVVPFLYVLLSLSLQRGITNIEARQLLELSHPPRRPHQSPA
jgi:methyltransferase